MEFTRKPVRNAQMNLLNECFLVAHHKAFNELIESYSNTFRTILFEGLFLSYHNMFLLAILQLLYIGLIYLHYTPNTLLMVFRYVPS